MEPWSHNRILAELLHLFEDLRLPGLEFLPFQKFGYYLFPFFRADLDLLRNRTRLFLKHLIDDPPHQLFIEIMLFFILFFSSLSGEVFVSLGGAQRAARIQTEIEGTGGEILSWSHPILIYFFMPTDLRTLLRLLLGIF